MTDRFPGARIDERLLGLFALLVLFAGAAIPLRAASSETTDPVFELGKVHPIEISIARSEWTVLQQSSARGSSGMGGTDYTAPDGRLIHVGSGFGGYFPWVHADITLDGKGFSDIGLRYRGNASFNASSISAPLRANFKAKLDLFGTDGTWSAIKTLNFNAGTMDNSLMREALAFAIFRAAGVPAPRTAYAQIRFTVPGLYDHSPGGFYVLIENVNKRFLKENLPPGTGLLMKPEGLRNGVINVGSSWSSFATYYRPDREASLPEQKRLMEFARLVSQTDVGLFRSQIGDYLDIDEFLRFVAVNAFLQNWDSYLSGNHNFYLYLDPKDDKFRFIPWDEDLSMGGRGGRGGFSNLDLMTPYRGDQPLIYWLLDDPAVLAKYQAIITELSRTAFSAEAIDKMVQTIGTAIGPRASSPRTYLASRAAYVQRLTESWRQKAEAEGTSEKPAAAP